MLTAHPRISLPPEERGAGQVFALGEDGVQPMTGPLQVAIIHGQRKRHVRGLRVHTQALQEAHKMGVGGKVVDLQAQVGCVCLNLGHIMSSQL